MSELKVIRTNTQPINTNVLWLNTEDNKLYKFDSNGWVSISSGGVYTTPFTVIDLVTDFFTQDDGYTIPCPQELVDAVHNGLTIVMPYGLGNSGGYTANVKFSDREISLEFLLNSFLFDCSLVRMRAIRHRETGVLEFIKGAQYSTFVYYQPLLTPGETIKTIASNDILGSGNLPAKDILKESTVFLEWYQDLDDGKSLYKDRAGYEAHNLKVYKRIAPALHYNPDKIVPNTEIFFVNVESTDGFRKPINTGILECINFELLHSTIFPLSVSTMSNFVPIQSIGVDCELIIAAAEGDEMPVWWGITVMIPSNSEFLKSISLNGTTYTSANNKITLPPLRTNSSNQVSSTQVDLITNNVTVTVDVTQGITINSFQIRDATQVSHVYFYYVGGKPLQISFNFPVLWENGENLSGTITDACFCELTINRIVKKSIVYDLVSLKTYKQ